VLLAESDWFGGRSDSTFARLEHARELIADRPPSPSKTKAYAEMSRFLMLAGRNSEAVEVGRESLALAKKLGLRDLQAHALNNIGTARWNAGDLEGLADLEEAFVIAHAINSLEALRARGNHASLVGDFGDLRRAYELYEEVIELSARFGNSGFGIWVGVELSFLDYLGGAWAAATRNAEAFFAAVSEVHYMETLARQIQAEIMIGRGESGRALAESERALAFARNVKDPQVLYVTLAVNARLLAIAGHTAEANQQTDELMELVAAKEYHANRWALLLAFTLDDLGRRPDGAELLSNLVNPTVWRKAALAYTAGDRVGAADILGEMGDRTDEAYARLRAAEEGAGPDQLNRALAFYRGVDATTFVRRVEAVLPASA